MSRFDKIEELIDRVPEYSVFVTVDELYARAAQVAAKAPELAELRVVGKSTKGSDIPMLTVGRGPVSILVFACPHPNEPIGAMMTHFLMEELIENPLLREGRAWHILPCVDPDGTRLNEGWFKGPFTIRNYAKGFYRPKPQDQVEWTFPITYKTLSWTTPKPETQALMEAILMAKPDVMYSLHNAGFGGAYYYVSHELPAECYEELRRIPVARGIELSLGEPEMPWVEELSPAVYKTTSTVDSYEYFAKFAPGDPAEFVVAGAGSTEWAQSQRDLFSLVTEVPYFTSPKTSDQNPVARARRDVLLEGLEALARDLRAGQRHAGAHEREARRRRRAASVGGGSHLRRLGPEVAAQPGAVGPGDARDGSSGHRGAGGRLAVHQGLLPDAHRVDAVEGHQDAAVCGRGRRRRREWRKRR